MRPRRPAVQSPAVCLAALLTALAAGGDVQAQPPKQDRQRDQAMLARLEQARLRQAEVKDGGFDTAGAAGAYAAAFREHGIDVARLAVGKAAARIRQQALRVELVTALDHWASLVPDAKTRRRLLEVAAAFDAAAPNFDATRQLDEVTVAVLPTGEKGEMLRAQTELALPSAHIAASDRNDEIVFYREYARLDLSAEHHGRQELHGDGD